MIYLELSGGLGNQMFEYAMARQVLEEVRKYNSNEKITILQSRFYKDIRNYDLGVFAADDNLILCGKLKDKTISFWYKLKKHLIMRFCLNNSKSITGAKDFQKMCDFGMICTTDVFAYHKYLIPKKKNYYVYGNYQCEKYFREIKQIIESDFRIKEGTVSFDDSILKRIREVESVSVHVRRGDYLSNEWKSILDVCSSKYYEDAIKKMCAIVENPVFFVFSNGKEDLEWVKKHIVLPPDTIFVDQKGDGLADFYLMKNCKHHVISNSTFSWWSSYLSNHDNKKVIAPSKWYKKNDQDFKDIYLDSWLLINVEE